MKDKITINIALDIMPDKKIHTDVHVIYKGESRNIISKISVPGEFGEDFLDIVKKDIGKYFESHEELKHFGA